MYSHGFDVGSILDSVNIQIHISVYIYLFIYLYEICVYFTV